MRRFNITVNGKAYDVQVEELAAGAPAPAPAPAPVAAAPAPAPAAAPAPAPAPAPAAAANATKVNSPMPGNILEVKVKEGDQVNANDMLLVLEAMKMENEIFAPVSGTVVGVQDRKSTRLNSSHA